MEQQPSASGARRDQDIALDLMKFIAHTANVVKPASTPTGFVSSGARSAEDHVTQLLELYGRCLTAVAGK